MDHTYVDEKSLKNLEDYAICLGSSILTLITLQNLQMQAIKLGIMKEQEEKMAEALIWNLRKAIDMFKDQMIDICGSLPDTFNAEEVINTLKQRELTKARSFIRKKKDV